MFASPKSFDNTNLVDRQLLEYEANRSQIIPRHNEAKYNLTRSFRAPSRAVVHTEDKSTSIFRPNASAHLCSVTSVEFSIFLVPIATKPAGRSPSPGPPPDPFCLPPATLSGASGAKGGRAELAPPSVPCRPSPGRLRPGASSCSGRDTAHRPRSPSGRAAPA